jgi:sterol desaturase/sphingolipid hydroxylase (fatty acid hydroxylase superfamily)
MASFFERVEWHGFFSIFPSDRGSLALALGFSAVWLVMKDFISYWYHRLQHSSKWLWAVHMLHHSDEHLNVTTTVRHCWLEKPLQLIFVVFPLFLLFRPPLITVPVATVLTNLLDNYIHLNLKLDFGRFSSLIIGPQFHRIHHSRLPEHRDKNFAVVFPLWDVLFGTYYHPRKDEYPPSGLTYGLPVDSLSRALVQPFPTWYRMILKRLKKAKV